MHRGYHVYRGVDYIGVDRDRRFTYVLTTDRIVINKDSFSRYYPRKDLRTRLGIDTKKDVWYTYFDKQSSRIPIFSSMSYTISDGTFHVLDVKAKHTYKKATIEQIRM